MSLQKRITTSLSLLLLLSGCAGSHNCASHGESPLLVASDYIVYKGGTVLIVTKLYGVNRKVEDIDLSSIRDKILVYSTHEDLQGYVGYHFNDMENDPRFLGSTWYSTVNPAGFYVCIERVDADGKRKKLKNIHLNAVAMTTREKDERDKVLEEKAIDIE